MIGLTATETVMNPSISLISHLPLSTKQDEIFTGTRDQLRSWDVILTRHKNYSHGGSHQTGDLRVLDDLNP